MRLPHLQIRTHLHRTNASSRQRERTNEWTNEQAIEVCERGTSIEFERSIQASCVHMSINTHICIRFITISHQVADISSFRGKEGVVFGWYVDVCSSNGNGNDSGGSYCQCTSDARQSWFFGKNILSTMWCLLSCSFSPVVRLSGRIIDDFLTV